METPILAPHRDDEVIWTAAECASFSLSSCGSLSADQCVSWRDLVWFSGRIPKQSMYSWMAFSNGLKTGDLLVTRGIITSSICCLCNSSQESCCHLFTECCFGILIWSKIAAKFSALGHGGSYFRNFYEKSNFNSVGEAIIAKLCISSFIWHIWKERNSKIFVRVNTPWESILACIMKEMQTRFTYLNMQTSVEIFAS